MTATHALEPQPGAGGPLIAAISVTHARRGSEPARQRGSAEGGKAAIIVMLSDIYGHATADALETCQVFARATGADVIAPDIFRGEPWSYAGPPPGGFEFEEWRSRLEGVRIDASWSHGRQGRPGMHMRAWGAVLQGTADLAACVSLRW